MGGVEIFLEHDRWVVFSASYCYSNELLLQ